MPRTPAPKLDDFTVGDWLAEPALNRLTSGQTAIRMRPQLMDVLLCLARHQGRVVLKDELLAEVWPDRVITESGMVRCIAELRQLLGDDSHEPRYIETIAKRGYRLVAAVEWRPAAPVPPETAPDRSQRAGEPPQADPPPAPAAPPAEAQVPGAARRARPVLTAAAVAVIVLAVVGVWRWKQAPSAALTEQDMVVLAFDNGTGDRVFDETLPLALAIQLEQSPFLRILPDERVRQTLTQMKRPADAAVTRTLGLELCERAGAAALIAGSVTPLGQHIVIGLEATACATGDVIGREQVEVGSKDEALAALGRAASQLRRDLGESRTSIAEYDVPITEATTASLDALRSFRRGDAARELGRSPEALRYYREAVSLDPEFALAHARLGSFALSMHYEPDAVAALQKAFALRDRVTFPERLEIDLVYHSALTGDENKITETLETMRRVYPRKQLVRRRLAQHYLEIGRFDSAVVEAEEARALDPGSMPALSGLAYTYLVTGRFGDARRAYDEAIARGLEQEISHANLLRIGFLTGDAALVQRERTLAETSPEVQPYVLEAEAEEAVWRGRLRDAVAYLERYQAFALQRGAKYRWAVLELRKARYEALCGWSRQARARNDRQLATGTLGPDLEIDALKVAISAGDVARAEQIVGRLDRAGWPKAEEPYAGFVRAYRAAIETERGRPARALELLKPMIPYELGLGWGLIPLHERARAHLRAGDWEAARDAFQKMLKFPGVFSGQKLLPSAQLGLARALAAGGQTDASKRAYEQFFDLWKSADPDLPVLADARREYAALR